MYSFQLETALAQSRAYLRLEFDRWCARWLVVTRSKTFDVHLVARTRRARAPARTRRGVKWKWREADLAESLFRNPQILRMVAVPLRRGPRILLKSVLRVPSWTVHGPFYFVVGMGTAAKKMNDRS